MGRFGLALVAVGLGSGAGFGSPLGPVYPAFGFVEHAAIVVVGRIVVEPGVEQVRRPAAGAQPAYTTRWRNARVRVDEVVMGRPDRADLRFSFQANGSPKWELIAQAARWRQGLVEWADRPLVPTGRRGVLILGGPEPDGRYRLASLGPIPDPDDPADAEEVRRVRLAVLTWTDPQAGLTSAAAADRYLAAGLLLHRYWWSGTHPRSEWRVSVPADLNELILRALAEREDWLTWVPLVGRPDEATRYLDRWRVGWPPWAGPEVAWWHANDKTVRGPLRRWLGHDRANRVTNWAVPAGAAYASYVGFQRWLDGSGGRWVIYTHPSALRPPAAGGWDR